MADNVTKISAVSRRGFLSKAVGVIAATAAVLPARAESQSLEQMASALHEAVGQYSDENCPAHVQVCFDGRSAPYEMDILRHRSVEEIQELLRPLFGDFSHEQN